MTYRERREARAERLRGWSEKRDAKASESFEKADRIAGAIPMGQPILVGHHSESRHRRDLARVHSGMDQGLEHSRKADEHRSRADNIEGQLDRSIYSDDPDAVEALRARVAELEAERDRIKAFNATARKGVPDHSLLTKAETEEWLSISKVSPYSLGTGGSFPAYKLANLSSNIKRNRDRIAQVEARQRRDRDAAAAGGVLIEGNETYVSVTFAEKPPRELLNELKAAGFTWGQGRWTGQRANLPASVADRSNA